MLTAPRSDGYSRTEEKLAVMAPFLRIGFSSFEIDPGLAYHEEVLNPYCAVYMKEAVETGESSLAAVAAALHACT